jgi:hypothetical protein
MFIKIITHTILIVIFSSVLIEDLIRISKIGIQKLKIFEKLYYPNNNFQKCLFVILNIISILFIIIVLLNSLNILFDVY